jgi:hypothetical protein
MMMMSPPKKKQKTELHCLVKAAIVRTLISVRDTKEKAYLYHPTLKQFSKHFGISERTITNWVKPSYRESIYKKAEKMVADGRKPDDDIGMFRGDMMSIDTAAILKGNVKMLLSSPSQTSSILDEDVLTNNDATRR